ncbi:hypothetical protein HMPREF9123_0857 [Neisseria bacilliformis ATCC BAA-1200]|uniref:Uncharacterized protein n=1 Tax=Neisseria bacilliformis ATCC BAA-1200 TaxID=888742 RepID=F2BAV3_9NEIS|nr:hypothetical protein HMPREF9123_0857 [Neisseria bacilliformis ATCC BAA-1200]
MQAAAEGLSGDARAFEVRAHVRAEGVGGVEAAVCGAVEHPFAAGEAAAAYLAGLEAADAGGGIPAARPVVPLRFGGVVFGHGFGFFDFFVGTVFQAASAVFFVEQAADVARLAAAVLPVGGRGVADAEGFHGFVAAHECPVFAFHPPNAEGVRADAAVADFAFGKFFFLFAAQAGGVPAHLHLAQRLLAEAGEGGVGVQVF